NPHAGGDAVDRWRPVQQEDPDGEHGGPDEDGVDGDGCGRIAMHEVAAEEDPAEGDEHGDDDEEVSGKRRTVCGYLLAGTAHRNESDADGGTDEGEPSFAVEAFVSEDGCAYGQDDRHGSDHKRGVAYGGKGKAVELDHELERDSEKSGEQDQEPIFAAEADGAQKRQKSQTGEEEPVEDHVAYVQLSKRDFSEVKAGSPAGSGERAGTVTEEGDGALLIGARLARGGYEIGLGLAIRVRLAVRAIACCAIGMWSV